MSPLIFVRQKQQYPGRRGSPCFGGFVSNYHADIEEEYENKKKKKHEEEEEDMRLRQDPRRVDMAIAFGSSVRNQEDDDENDEDELAMRKRLDREQTIQALMDKQDKEFRQQRKRKTWGKYANATTPEEVEKLEEQERQRIDEGRWSNATSFHTNCSLFHVCVLFSFILSRRKC